MIVDKQEIVPGAEKSAVSQQQQDVGKEAAASAQKFYFDSDKPAQSAKLNGQISRELEKQGQLGRLELIASGSGKPEQAKAGSTPDAGDTDGSDHVNVGDGLNWSKQAREHARPREGQGYYDVMKAVGADLLKREVQPEEVKLLVSAAMALQEQRGKNPKELSTHDELLPKNEEELSVFMSHLIVGNQPHSPGDLGDRQVKEFQQGLQGAFDQHFGKITGDQIVTDLRPVKDQPVVTKVVPSAVYIDSSNIEGGQGYRRKEDCTKETQDYWMSRPAAEAFMRAQQWLVKNHHDPMQLNNMNGAGRRALDRELISKCAPDQPHAKKHSQHEDGISVDVDNYDDANVRQALTREGFVHNVPGDRPHFTWLPKKK
jgi:hypothetical protein